jgi:nucleotide-binding universal stress UspA family protein
MASPKQAISPSLATQTSANAPLVGVPAIREILFPTDLTSASDSVVPYLRALAERFKARIHAVHVVSLEHGEGPPIDRIAAAEAQMKRFRESNPFPGIDVEFRIERGLAWESVLATLDQDKIDLIVVGTHGRHGLKKIILGSVAEQIFRHAPCPVITVGPDAAALPDGKLLRPTGTSAEPAFAGAPRILCATDFSPESLRALDYAVSLADEFDAHLTLLYVMQEFSEAALLSIDQITRISRDRLCDLVPRDLGISTDVVVEFGSPPDTILRLSDENQCSLIVLGARKLGAIGGRLPWSTAYSVVCEAHCPVLTVRA